MAKYCPLKRNYALYYDCNECTEKLCDAFFCLIVSNPSFADYEFFRDKLDHLLQNQKLVVIVCGREEVFAKRYAEARGHHLMVFPDEWGKHDADYRGNIEMHKFIANFAKRGCTVFWNGTSQTVQDNFDLAKEYNTPLKVYGG